MWDKIRRFFLSRYDSQRLIVRMRNQSLFLVLSTILSVSALVAVIIDTPAITLVLSGLSAVILLLLFLIRKGHAGIVNHISVILISLLFAVVVFLPPYAEGAEIFSILAYQLVMIIIAGLIAAKSYQMFIIMGIGGTAFVLEFVLRIVPGGGFEAHWRNLVICLLILPTATFIGRAIMNRSERLLELAEKEAEKNRNQVGMLESVILSSRDALGMGLAVRQSAERSEKLVMMLRENLDTVKANMRNLSEKTLLINESNVEIASSSKIVQKQITDQTAIVAESSSAIEEMTASITNISDITTARQKSIDLLKQMTIEGEKEVSNASDAVESMKASTASIMEIVKVIKSVANQTNLLAMNAAIEAAHAGNAGSGFSVVAGEIRKLSEETSRQVKIIDTSIKGTINSIKTASSTSVEAKAAFGRIAAEADSVTLAMKEIGQGLEEISRGTDEILQGVTESVTITHHVKDASDTVDQKIEAAGQNLELLRGISSDVLASLEQFLVHFDQMLAEARIMSEAGVVSETGLRKLALTLETLQPAQGDISTR